MTIKKLDPKELDAVIYNALNEAVFQIQTAIGVTTGDVAGIFFTGPEWDALTSTMKRYVAFEEALDGE